MNRPLLRIVLVGTGTGVGKTHVACALLHQWAESGASVVGLKPIETGLAASGSDSSDQARLSRAAFHVKHPERAFHVKRSLYEFPDPVSPHLAARDQAVRIELGAIRRWVAREAQPVTIVETAGGLFSPVDQTNTNLELAVALRPALVVLVAPDRLGVLHDLTATLGLARARGLTVDAVVLSAPQVSDASTGRNEQELRRLNIADVRAVFPRAVADDTSSLEAAARVIDWIDGISDAATSAPRA